MLPTRASVRQTGVAVFDDDFLRPERKGSVARLCRNNRISDGDQATDTADQRRGVPALCLPAVYA